MNKYRNALSFTALIAILISTTVTAQSNGVNVLKDASFEQESPGDPVDWGQFEITMISRNHARSGEYSMYNGGYSRSVPHPPYFVGNASGSFQEFPAEPGSRWRLTGYGLVPDKLEGNPAFGALQLSFFDQDGADLGTVESSSSDTKAKLSAQINTRSDIGEWIALDTGVATAPEGTATIQAFTLYVDYSGTGRTQGVYFDDLALCEVSGRDDSCQE